MPNSSMIDLFSSYVLTYTPVGGQKVAIINLRHPVLMHTIFADSYYIRKRTLIPNSCMVDLFSSYVFGGQEVRIGKICGIQS
jgi:hypothetical protein